MSSTNVALEPAVAHVGGIPLSCYTGWQHSFLSPLSLSRLGVHCRRAAFDSGWLGDSDASSGGFFSLSRDSASRRILAYPTDASQTASDNDTVASTTFSTVFAVAMDIHLCDQHRPVTNLVAARGELFVAAIGTSSFALGGTFFAKFDEMSNEVCIGTVQLSYVHIDFGSRRPLPLPAVKRSALEAAFRPELASTLPKITRLSYDELFSKSTHSDNECVLKHSKQFVLRPTDFDFNFHLNQSIYQAFAVDTLKEAVVTWICTSLQDETKRLDPVSMKAVDVIARLMVHKDVAPSGAALVAFWSANAKLVEQAVFQLDAAISALRIDYLREIPVRSLGDAVSSDERVVVSVQPQRGDWGACEAVFSFAVATHGASTPNSIGTLRLTCQQ